MIYSTHCARLGYRRAEQRCIRVNFGSSFQCQFRSFTQVAVESASSETVGLYEDSLGQACSIARTAHG